nr:unnamed protein product [Callosobruchus chinensis]
MTISARLLSVWEYGASVFDCRSVEARKILATGTYQKTIGIDYLHELCQSTISEAEGMWCMN